MNASSDLDDHIRPRNPVLSYLWEESNFFRIHLLVFTLIPLVSSGVFYAANDEYHIAYIDCLFLTYSSMTVTGLSTVNLSTTTRFQQSILFVLMLLGDVTMVALVMVLVRKWYFRLRCQDVIRNQRPSLTMTITRQLTHHEPHAPHDLSNNGNIKHPNMLRRFSLLISAPYSARPLHAEMDAEGGRTLPRDVVVSPETQNNALDQKVPVMVTQPTPSATLGPSAEPMQNPSEDLFGLGDTVIDSGALTSSPQGLEQDLPLEPSYSRTGGVGFASHQSDLDSLRKRREFPRSATVLSAKSRRSIGGTGRTKARDQGLGGLLGPLDITKALASRIIPQKLHREIERKFTIPATTTLVSHSESARAYEDPRTESVSWLKEAVLKVQRNSNFLLTDDQLEEVGGVEYRALRVLSYLVAGYFIGTQLFSLLLIGPYMSTRYEDVFTAQPRLISKWWFSAFQVVASYTGGGMSLVDLGMTPFQKDYLMIISMSFVILAGNHALPIFLRLVIWLWTKVLKENSELNQTLHFLLHHPRRCFLYLFPSPQTWYLVTVLVLFSCIEWAAFMVLNIGLEVTESLPVGTRLIDGFFQGLAVRASGFSIVSIASLAPAVQFLYVVMMYIAVYPVAMSIRSTNVYEERSLGVYEEEAPDEDEEPDMTKVDKGERVGKYLNWHLRRQVANDIWWLVWGVWLVCVIERTKILDPDTPWFSIFRICFELVSAFGGIGLSLGTPNDNFAFSGACGPLSKLVIIVIMLRGRHRGLPVAVDRSIQLPKEFSNEQRGKEADIEKGEVTIS